VDDTRKISEGRFPQGGDCDCRGGREVGGEVKFAETKKKKDPRRD